MMTEEFVDDEKHELTEDMLLLTKAALDRGACPLCVARSFTDTAAGIALAWTLATTSSGRLRGSAPSSTSRSRRSNDRQAQRTEPCP